MKPRAGLSGLFPIALMALLAGLTLWLDRSTRSDAPAGDARLRHDPDSWVDNAHLRRYGPDGRLQHDLRAASMLHFPDDDTTEMGQPTLTYVRPQASTHARADTAVMQGKGEVVTLRGNVRVVRDASGDHAEMVAEMPQLVVWPDDERARTDAPVRIRQGESVITGVGMDIDNIELVYRLHHDVRGVIQPGERR